MKLVISLLCTIFLALPSVSAQDLASGTVILSDLGAYSVDYSNVRDLKWGFEREYKVVIRKEEDLDFLKYVAIETNNNYNEELKEALVEVRSPSGGKVSFNQSNFVKEPFSLDIIDYNLEVDGLSVNDTLVVSYRTVADLSNRIHRWDIQYAYPVLRSEVSFLVPEAFSYVDHLSDQRFLADETAISNTVSVNRTQKLQLKGVRLKCKNIPAYTLESMAPELAESRPAFFFTLTDLAPVNYDAFLPDWDTQCSDLIVNEYWGKQFRVKSNYHWLAKQAAPVLKLNTDERTKLWKCYELIHKLFSWDGSVGLFPSYTIEEMEGQREVNKAALNSALLALLKAADLRAFPVLVNTIDQAPVHEEIPDINQFNHFIIVVGIGDQAVYVDAGDPSLPIGYIDQSIRHNPAILIRNYKGVWVAIEDFESRSMFVTDLHLKSDGSATGKITCSFEGYDAQSERNMLLRDKKAQYWKNRAAVLAPEIRVDSVRFKNVRNGTKPMSSVVHFHIDAGSGDLKLQPFFYSFFDEALLSKTSRSNPLIFPFRMQEHFSLNLTYPEGQSPEFDNTARKVALEGGEASFEYVANSSPQKAEIRASIKVTDTTMDTSDYLALKTFFEKVSGVINTPVQLSR